MSVSGIPCRDEEDLVRLQRLTVAYVRSPLPDLTQRQAAIMLTVYVYQDPLTVRVLARELGVGKPVITRGVSALQALGYMTRIRDPDDGRSVLVGKTKMGMKWINEYIRLNDAI
ncbi:MAG: hypothetical protein A2808_01730 [Candidatus Moranbacteria bacterium RIFCSPHIGHO2_01_FULL_55_24]|nr:MAG: hypothetical protein A2808_01730 [Candidatus Moranbacteria bacterium RIFCSPHIGHO2_01_FULL_55_24]